MTVTSFGKGVLTTFFYNRGSFSFHFKNKIKSKLQLNNPQNSMFMVNVWKTASTNKFTSQQGFFCRSAICQWHPSRKSVKIFEMSSCVFSGSLANTG